MTVSTAPIPTPTFDEQRFRKIVDELDHVVVWEFDDTAQHYTFVSQHSALVLGYDCDAWRASPSFLHDHVVPEDRPKWEELLHKLRSDPEVNDLRLDHRCIKADGSTAWMHSGVHREEEGGRVLLRGVMVDIDRLKRAEERERSARADAERAISVRDEVLAVVTHDLRSPLGNVRLAAEALTINPESLARTLPIIRRAVKRMEALIDDLVDAANIRARGLTLSRTSIHTGSFVAELVEEFRDAFAESGVSLHHRVDADVSLSCDPGRIGQVVSNLLNNALKFTARGGTVTFAVTVDDLEATFTVEDTGPGIEPEAIDKVFDRSWQAQATAHLGSGMGLYIAKSVIDAHAGRIWVTSEIGKGSVFSFTLPRG
ncbi:MAG: PAS domain-containing sensor histidine kinase [Deltaproteobacteria bacterium]|nr:PAS domain-containing sensor histidine kinase [Deltaproteobacteria bacterium]